MSLDRKTVSVAIPASVVSDTPHLREKTAKIGLIGRAAAIFRVNELVIYSDCPKTGQMHDMDLIATLLSYMETPQYLRKRLFGLKPELQFAGILPPLRTSHHPLNRESKRLRIGEYREGVVLSKGKEGCLVDIGVERPAVILEKQLPQGQRVTVKVAALEERVLVEATDRTEITRYWGYRVVKEQRSFGKLVKSRGFDLVIATSKRGTPWNDVSARVKDKWETAKDVLVAFGAPSLGLYEIAQMEGVKLEDVADFVVNTIPEQGTETVRTEEALLVTLAILNVAVRV